MKKSLNRQQIADEVYFTSITDEKFKINRISVIFVTKLSDSAAVNAVIPRILTKCNEKLDTMSKLNRRLSDLYSASINWSVHSETDYQLCELNATVLGNRFALDGEDIVCLSRFLMTGCSLFQVLISRNRTRQMTITRR